jgi:zinc protease
MSTSVSPRPSRPIPGATRDYHFPRFERLSLPNGLRVVVAPSHRLPIATVLAVTDAGALWDRVGREGTATLTARLLLEGAGTLDGAELAERFEQLGATMESGADWDSAITSMTVTSAHLARAMELFAMVLRAPTFRPREVDRLKAERLSDILQLRSEPRGLADEAFEAAVYDSTSRYSTSVGGSEASVTAVDADDIRALFEARYSPTTTTLIITGDVTPAHARKLAEESFGTWAGSAKAGAPRADRAARETRATHHVIRPDSPQSEIRIGHVGVPRTHPDYFDLVVMNAILGGLFNSRINLNLREAHAYTYGAFSAFDWRRDAGPLVISTAVRTDVTAQAITEVVSEIDRMRREPVGEHELTLATSYLDGVFPIRYETTAAVAVALANQVIFGLPDDYFDTYRAHIRNVTVSSVHRAAKAHLHADKLQAVVVGDPAVGDALRALAFGEFIQRTPDSR